MDDFKIILNQCESLAKTLIDMDVCDEFFQTLDVFDNCFNQLKQIIENSSGAITYDRVEDLHKMIETYSNKVAGEITNIKDEAKSAALKKQNIGAYGTTKMNIVSDYNKLS